MSDTEFSSDHSLDIHISVAETFVSRKAAISWAAAGMKKENDTAWLTALACAVGAYRPLLLQAMSSHRPLQISIIIYGTKRRLDGLDIHDAAAQTIDQLTNIVFPRPPGSRTPQWQDKCFWRVVAQKIIRSEAYVEIEIAALQDASGQNPEQ